MRVVLVLLVACSGKAPDSEPKQDSKPAPSPLDAQPIEPPPRVVPNPDAAKDGLPAECADYRQLADKLAACTALGAQRDLLTGEFDASWKAWSLLPATEHDKVAAACKAAAQALRIAAGATCNW